MTSQSAIEWIEDYIVRQRAEHAIRTAELERAVRQLYMNLSGVIRMEYEKLSAGTRVSFTINDGPVTAPVGAEQMEGGYKVAGCAMHFPATKHNLGVLKQIVEHLENCCEESDSTATDAGDVDTDADGVQPGTEADS